MTWCRPIVLIKRKSVDGGGLRLFVASLNGGCPFQAVDVNRLIMMTLYHSAISFFMTSCLLKKRLYMYDSLVVLGVREYSWLKSGRN